MVAAFIFILHVAAAVYAFVRYRKDGEGSGWLAVGFVALIFAVGWSITTMLTNLLFTPEFFVKWYYHETRSMVLRTVRKEFNRDTIALLMLTAGEIAFYYLYLGSDTRASGRKRPDSAAD
jgi:hypothetical protein